MFTTAEKSNTTRVNRQQQTAGTTFFRKAGEDAFFGPAQQTTFFNPTVQAKLTVSSPDDPQEKEADTVADQVMRMPDPVSIPAAGNDDDSIQKKEISIQHPVVSRMLQCKGATPPPLASMVQRSYLGDDTGAATEGDHFISLYPSDVIQRSGRGPPAGSMQFEQSLTSSKGGGAPLPGDTRQYMESRFNADFSGVRIHTDSHAQGLSTQIHAQAFTHGNDIYFNSGKYNPHTSSGGLLLAHELTHTIQQGASTAHASGNAPAAVARKPIIQRSYGAPVSQLDNAIQHAKSQEGKIIANKEGGDGYRTGWQQLLEIFKSTFGEDKVISGSGGTAVPGTVSEMDIKKKRTAEGVQIVDPDHTDRTMTGDRDAMPSWCGIFVFWALNKSGVPMPKWQLGQNVLKPESLNPPGATPKPGDIAWRQAYSHFAIVESVSGDTVRTVNGNTAGEDNLGGQVQTREHPISNWTAFFNPLATMEGSLGSGEGPVNEKPKTLSELRKELLRVNRKEDSEQEELSASETDRSVQAKSELSAWSVDGSGQLQTGQPASANINNNPVQPKEEAQNEEEEELVQRSVIDDALSYIGSVTDCISLDLDEAKSCALGKAQEMALHIPGYRALRVVLGRDPIVGGDIERNGRNFLEAAFDLMPGGLSLHQKLEEQHQLDAAAAWIGTQIATLETLVNGLFSEIEVFWNSIGLTDLGSPMEVLRNGANIVLGFIDKVIDFAVDAALELLEMIKEYLLTKIVEFIREHTTAYPLLTVILGRDPITEEEVPTNGTTILNALLELGGEEGIQQRTQMQETGTFQKAVDFIDEGISLFSSTYDELLQAFHNIWNIVTIDSLMDPVGTFTQIYNQFAGPVGRVLDFVLRVGAEILKFIKEVLMQRLSAWAKEQRGYDLVTVLIGKDPFTNAVVPRNVENIIKGFMSLMEGGREQFDQLKESGAIDRTVAKVNAAVARLNMTPAYIVQLFIDLWNSFSLSDLANPIAAFQRIIDRFGEPIGRLIAFVIQIVKIVIEAILIIMNFPFDLINNIITKAMQAFEMIKRDPVGFLKNLLRAIKQGFIQFFDNILQHLLSGLVGWLTSELRDAGVPAFSDTSLQGIIAWVLQVLGISMEKIWEKLAAHPRIGPERVARIRSMINTLEGIWTFIKDVQERGMAAIWDKIQEQLSNLWNTILDAVKNWIMEQIVNRMVTRLLSMLDPTGIMAVVNSAIALYSAIQSFIKYLREMLEVVNSFVEGVVDIASGNVATAANYLERTLARAVPIVIGFLANQVGLSGIGRRVGEMIGRAQEMVDQALTWLVNRAVDTGLDLLDRAMAMGREVVEGLMEWLGLRNDFRSRDGGEHHIFFTGSESNAVMMVASNNPQPVEAFLESKKDADPNANLAHQYLISTVKPKEADVEAKDAIYRGISGDRRDEKRAARYAHQQAVQALRGLMRLFADKLELVDFSGASGTDANLNVRTSVSKGDDNGRAKFVMAWPLTYLPGDQVGGPPAADPPGWRNYAQNATEQWVRGHLLSEHLHGPGQLWNLMPIIQVVNSQMEGVESQVIPLVRQQGKLHYYEVNVTYNDNRSRVNEKNIPTSITITWGELNQVGTPGNDADRKTTHIEGPFTQGLPTFGGAPNLNTAGEGRIGSTAIGTSLARDIRVVLNRFVETHGGFYTLDDLIDKMTKFYANQLTPKEGLEPLSQPRRKSALEAGDITNLTNVIEIDHTLKIERT